MVSSNTKRRKRRRKGGAGGAEKGPACQAATVNLRPARVPDPPVLSLPELAALPGPYTTVQVARLACVCDKTVKNWIDRGQLEGYRLPAKSDGFDGPRRVTKAALVKFLKANGMPMNGLVEAKEG